MWCRQIYRHISDSLYESYQYRVILVSHDTVQMVGSEVVWHNKPIIHILNEFASHLSLRLDPFI